MTTRYRCWVPDDGEVESDGGYIAGFDPQEAAQTYAEKRYDDSAGEVGVKRVTVFVRSDDPPDVEPLVLVVEPDVVIDWYAREETPPEKARRREETLR